VTEPRSGACGHAADVGAQHPDDTGRRRLEPGDHAQERALAGAARTEHAEHLTAAQFEIRSRQGRRVTLVRSVNAEHIAQFDDRLLI
jgi:hypothetical protein